MDALHFLRSANCRDFLAYAVDPTRWSKLVEGRGAGRSWSVAPSWKLHTSTGSMNQQKIDRAIGFAIEHETAWTREAGDGWGIHHLDPAPWNRLLGPVHARGPVSGTIVLDGKPLTSWGEPQRADLTFSIAKTYLALLAGVAHDRGLLPDVNEPVVARVPGIGFEGRN